MIEIQLTKGYVAIVDDVDSDLAEFKWTALVSKTRVYGIRGIFPNGKKGNLLLHRVILSRMLNRDLTRSEYVDHEKGNGLLNVRSNLRLATPLQNGRNRDKYSTGKHPYKGIGHLGKGHVNKPWLALIHLDGRSIYLGTFGEAIDAHRAWCIAALTHHKEFANFGESSPFTGFTLADFDKPAVQLPLPLKDAA